jgi:hypothetical protein
MAKVYLLGNSRQSSAIDGKSLRKSVIEIRIHAQVTCLRKNGRPPEIRTPDPLIESSRGNGRNRKTLTLFYLSVSLNSREEDPKEIFVSLPARVGDPAEHKIVSDPIEYNIDRQHFLTLQFFVAWKILPCRM